MHANMYGPTVGDKVRWGDTRLIVQVEKKIMLFTVARWWRQNDT